MPTVDLAVLIILAIAALTGYIKGIYNTMAGIVTFLLAFFIAFQFYGPCYELIDQQTGLQESLAAYIRTEFPVVASIEQHAEALEEIKPYLSLFLDSDGKTAISDSIINANLSQELSRQILLSLTFIGLYMLTKILLSLIIILLKKKSEKEGLDWDLRLAGAIVEACKYLAVILVLLAVVLPVIDVGAALEQSQALAVKKALKDSVFYTYFRSSILFVQNVLHGYLGI